MAHELRQEVVAVDDGELSAALHGVQIDAFGLQAWAEGLPVVLRRHQDHAFAVGERGGGEAADGAVEELLVLIQLHDVIARRRVGQEAAPGFALVQGAVLLPRTAVYTADNGRLHLCHAAFMFHALAPGLSFRVAVRTVRW